VVGIGDRRQVRLGIYPQIQRAELDIVSESASWANVNANARSSSAGLMGAVLP
jgi:hypothetical protein